jgi:cation diffusion facilitator family transporter
MAHGAEGEKPIAVIAAVVANFLIAISKFVAGGLTGSSSMISEGIHSLVDTGNQSLLLLGLRLSRRPADENHPFGHGKELYFWGLIVAVILFGLGGGMSIYEGITHIQHPVELENPTWNYIVLGIAFLMEGTSFTIAARQFLRITGSGSPWQALHSSKDPSLFIVLYEDAAALLGLIIAGLGVFLSHQLNLPYLDGAASILIGIVLSIVAVLLAYESRSLLLGEAVAPAEAKQIRQIVSSDPAVEQVSYPQTMHFGPNDILLALSVQFTPGLPVENIPGVISRLEKNIQAAFPKVRNIFIEAQSISSAGESVPDAGIAEKTGD